MTELLILALTAALAIGSAGTTNSNQTNSPTQSSSSQETPPPPDDDARSHIVDIG